MADALSRLGAELVQTFSVRDGTWVAHVVIGGEPRIVKWAHVDDEGDALMAWQHVSAVPRLLHHAGRLTVREWVDGVKLSDHPDGPVAFARQVGRVLSELHVPVLAGHRFRTVSERMLGPPEQPSDRDGLTGLAGEYLRALELEVMRREHDVPVTLLHGDPHAGNFIVDMDGAVRVFDPAPVVGHPAFDLAYFARECLDDPGRLLGECLQGYGREVPLLDLHLHCAVLGHHDFLLRLFPHARKLDAIERLIDRFLAAPVL